MHQQAVQCVQTNMDQQSESKQPSASRQAKEPVHEHCRQGMQRMETDAATSGFIDKISQQMIQID